MQCPACGNQNKAGANFCAFCGYALVIDSESESLYVGQLMDGGVYRIIRQLGKGGMGAVYLAANTKAFDRPCVIKEVIEYYDANNPEERKKAAQRFEIEARMLATLKHQGIPDIYAYFSENGRNYLVMEYIEGPNLAQMLTRQEDNQVIKGRPLKAEDVTRYTIQVCEVLNYLEQHQPPVIHNDIKPANIILDKNTGRAVLVDFGTARTRYSQQSAGQPGRQQSSLYGTVGYAAPELYDGQAEPRSDVYALAATAYHLLTDDDPRLHPFQFPKMDAIPAMLREVLNRGLAVKVQDRPSAAEFGRRLEALLKEQAAPPLPLTFPQNDLARNRDELILLSVKHWAFAGEVLYDGSMARWLRDALHDVAAARAAEESVRKYPQDVNAGLEYFIRTLSPQAMPQPQLKVMTGRLRYDHMAAPNATQKLQVQNAGGGYLYGVASSSVPWIEVQGRLTCPPGQTQALPVVVRTELLTPGQTYQAQVKIQASGAQTALVQVEVKVPPAVVDVSPAQIELEMGNNSGLFTGRAAFEVSNRGEVRADCAIEGQPEWLVLSPARFTCLPKQSQMVELVGRVDKLPDPRRVNSAQLTVQVQGGAPRPVQVVVMPRARRSNKTTAILLIGLAVVVLLGAVAWFLISVLPVLLQLLVI